MTERGRGWTTISSHLQRAAAHAPRLDYRDGSKTIMVAHISSGKPRHGKVPFWHKTGIPAHALTHVAIKHRRCGAARPRPKAHGTEALLRDAAVLIAWQHQDILGISRSMLTQDVDAPPNVQHPEDMADRPAWCRALRPRLRIRPASWRWAD
jgi:hypothetical protein